MNIVMTVAATIGAIDVNPSAPPGSERVLDIVNWLAWAAMVACVAGIIITAITMALSHRRGEGGEHAGRLGWVMGAAILIGMASGLVAFLTA